jgi:hypothetical protein
VCPLGAVVLQRCPQLHQPTLVPHDRTVLNLGRWMPRLAQMPHNDSELAQDSFARRAARGEQQHPRRLTSGLPSAIERPCDCLTHTGAQMPLNRPQTMHGRNGWSHCPSPSHTQPETRERWSSRVSHIVVRWWSVEAVCGRSWSLEPVCGRWCRRGAAQNMCFVVTQGEILRVGVRA